MILNLEMLQYFYLTRMQLKECQLTCLSGGEISSDKFKV